MDVFGSVAFSGVAVSLNNRLDTKQITLQDFLRECAFWALKDGFDELRIYPFPTPPRTEAFNEYERLSPDRKKKVDPDVFRKNLEILAYYTQVKFVENRNKDTLKWLKDILSYLPEDDFVSRKKVEDRILEFTYAS